MARTTTDSYTTQLDNDHPIAFGRCYHSTAQGGYAHHPDFAAAHAAAQARGAATSPTPEQVAAYAARLAALAEAQAAAKAEQVQAVAAHKAQGVADKAAKARLAEALAYVGSYVGTWGLPLDIRADRRWGTKYMTLTDRQVDALLTGKARDAQRAEAQALAQELRADDLYQQYIASRTAAGSRNGTSPAPTAAPTGNGQHGAPQRVTQDGMYQLPDGTVVKVQAAVHGSGQLYAKRLVVADGHGTFVYERGLVSRLSADMRLTREQAAAYGKLYGVCAVCGRTLTDERSIADGIGPVCAGRDW